MSKIKIGGIIQNAHLSALCILGIADRPGIAAAVLTALAEQCVNEPEAIRDRCSRTLGDPRPAA